MIIIIGVNMVKDMQIARLEFVEVRNFFLFNFFFFKTSYGHILLSLFDGLSEMVIDDIRKV